MPLKFPFSDTFDRISIPNEFANANALMTYLGIERSELKKIWFFRRKMYHVFDIDKGNGKTRSISAPNERLKHLQRQIALAFDKMYRVRNPVHGFVKNKSVKTNAESHLDKNFIINIDIKDFFPTITEKRVTGLFRSLGLDDDVARILSRLTCNAGSLPQGAPTSPIISNMICLRLDRDLQSFAKSARSIFTRYADDLTFSSYHPMNSFFEGGAAPAAGRFNPNLLSFELQNIFAINGFKINTHKSHYADRNSRRMVTGLKVNEILNVDRRYVRNIRATIFSVEKFGLQIAQEKFEKNHKGSCQLGSHLAGKINWLSFIRGRSDPVFRALATRYNSSFPKQEIKIAPTNSEIRDRSIWIVEHMSEDLETMAQGTAFFLDGVGLITAAHCVGGAKSEIEIYHPSKPANKFSISILKIDPDLDLAILGHTIPSTEYFELQPSFRDVIVGDELTGCGYPSFGPGDKINVRDGKVTSLPVKSSVQLIEVSQKLPQGMSGGPLVDFENRVVGIIKRGGPFEPRDYAISIKALNKLLSD